MPSHDKSFERVVLPRSFLVFILQSSWDVGHFQPHILIPIEILHSVFVGCRVWTTLTLKCHTCSQIIPSLCREQVGPEWAVCLPSECCRPTGCHGNALMPIKHCDTIAYFWGQRGFFDAIWDALTLTHRGLAYEYLELLFWRFVDTDEMKMHQMGGSNWCSVLSPSLDSGPQLFSGSWHKTRLYRISVWSRYILKGPLCHPLQDFPIFERGTFPKAHWKFLIPEP